MSATPSLLPPPVCPDTSTTLTEAVAALDAERLDLYWRLKGKKGHVGLSKQDLDGLFASFDIAKSKRRKHTLAETVWTPSGGESAAESELLRQQAGGPARRKRRQRRGRPRGKSAEGAPAALSSALPADEKEFLDACARSAWVVLSCVEPGDVDDWAARWRAHRIRTNILESFRALCRGGSTAARRMKRGGVAGSSSAAARKATSAAI